MVKVKIVALISGGGTNLQAILDACEVGDIEAEVVLVGSDNPDSFGLQRAKNFLVPTFIIDYNSPLIVKAKEMIANGENLTPVLSALDFSEIFYSLQKQKLMLSDTDPVKLQQFFVSRYFAEKAILSKLKNVDFDLLVLAGYMRVFTPFFIDKINIDKEGQHKHRIMNIHPALLPAFPGTDGYGDTYYYGCKQGGCTVHWIDYGEDTGPIIGQRSFVITADMDLEAVKKKGLAQEYELFPECIQMFAGGEIGNTVTMTTIK